MTTTVTSKGQVTIPKSVREFIGVGPGDSVHFRLGPDGGVVIERADGTRPPSRIAALRGHAGPGLSTDEIMAMTRGDD